MSSFGRKKRFIQEANRRSVLKGTVGMFGKWCKSQGLAKDGKVTLRCINKAKRSGNTTLIRRATFAKNIGGYAGAKHRKRSRFGLNTTGAAGFMCNNTFKLEPNSGITAKTQGAKDFLKYAQDLLCSDKYYQITLNPCHGYKEIINDNIEQTILFIDKNNCTNIKNIKDYFSDHLLNIQEDAERGITDNIERKKSLCRKDFLLRKAESYEMYLEDLNTNRCLQSYVNQKNYRRFGKRKTSVKKTSVKKKKSVKKTGPRKKYTSAGGRKSPSESATKFSVGTIKTGLDGGNWVIKKASNGIKRWVKMKSMFGKFRFGAYADDYLQQIMIEEEKKILLPKIEKEIEIAEKFIDIYPKNDTLKRRAIKILNNAKEKFVKIATIENGKRFISITISTVEILTTLLLAMIGMKEAYSALYGASATFRGLAYPLEKLLNLFRRKNDQTVTAFNRFNNQGAYPGGFQQGGYPGGPRRTRRAVYEEDFYDE